MDPNLFAILRAGIFLLIFGAPVAYVVVRSRVLMRRTHNRKTYQPFKHPKKGSWPFIEHAMFEIGTVAIVMLLFGTLWRVHTLITLPGELLAAQDIAAGGGFFVSLIVMGFVAFTYLNGKDALHDNRLQSAPILSVQIHDNGSCLAVSNMTGQPAFGVRITLKSQWRPGDEEPTALADTGLIEPHSSVLLQANHVPLIEEDDALRIEWKSFGGDAYGREYPL